MRKLLKTIMFCAVLLPLSQVQAAGAPGKTYGGFASGKKFKFTVSEVISAQATLTGASKKVPVPKGIPKFKKGQKVQFKIGKKGQLTGPGFQLPFKSDGGSANVYVTVVTKKNPKGNVGTVYKGQTKKGAIKPTGVALSFFKTTGSGFGTKITSVYYIFK